MTDVTTEQILIKIAKTRETQFAHLLLFNSIHSNGTASLALQRLSEIHANLMGLQAGMASLQFLLLESSAAAPDPYTNKLVHTILVLRYLGFIFLFAGALVSLVTQEYLKSMEGENLTCQVDGILTYAWFFRTSELFAVVAAVLFGTTATLTLHGNLPTGVFWSVGSVASLLALWFLGMWYKIIIGRQTYGDRHLYGYHDKLNTSSPSARPVRHLKKNY